MNEFKKGDRITATGTVTGAQGDYVTFRPDGACYTQSCNVNHCTLIDHEEVKVGDRVRLRTPGGGVATITDVVTGYQIALDGATCNTTTLWRDSHVEKIPPKPTFRVERKNDELRLYRNEEESPHIAVPMSDTSGVAKAIRLWPDQYGIDADELRELANEAHAIGKVTEGRIVAEAWRTASGWWAVLGVGINRDQMCHERAKTFFPETNGHYIE